MQQLAQACVRAGVWARWLACGEQTDCLKQLRAYQQRTLTCPIWFGLRSCPELSPPAEHFHLHPDRPGMRTRAGHPGSDGDRPQQQLLLVRREGPFTHGKMLHFCRTTTHLHQQESPVAVLVPPSPSCLPGTAPPSMRREAISKRRDKISA